MRQPKDFANRPVESLQAMLRFISTADMRILPVIPNGSYNGNTYASVRSFQETVGFSPNGVTDQGTWEAIVNSYDQSTPSLTVPITQPSWNVGQAVQPGEFNYHIFLVQAMLYALSDFIPALSQPKLTGILDNETQQGLQLIQNAANIRPDGTLNTATWHYLNGLYRAIVGNGVKK